MLDQSLKFLSDPYLYISKQSGKLNSKVFASRILLKDTICLVGAEGAALFYSSAMVRKGAAPGTLKATLLGKNSVQTMDGIEHKKRKSVFMDIMTKTNIDELMQIAHKHWHLRAQEWAQKEEIVLYTEAQYILTQTVCEWFGVPLSMNEAPKRTADLMYMFDRASAKGLAHLRSRMARKRSEQWIMELIEEVRRSPHEISPSHLKTFALQDLPLRDATVEVLNVLRPTVAVSLYFVFLAHALHLHPEYRNKGMTEIEEELFIHEVRRFYPFFPAAIAKARDDFEWKGMQFKKGQQVMLDLYGTNHDPSVWKDPDVFDPKRFQSWNKSEYNFVPQGGGDHRLDHRCAGEWITIALMKGALRFLTQELVYEVPPQDLTLDFSRLPANVRSRFIMRRPVRMS